jgi:peptidoglycan L-alanyl-D-glutamate endopeptidase CwlK
MKHSKFGKNSKRTLAGVNPVLAKIAYRAIELSEIDFGVHEGVRSKERQAYLVKNGASRTMKSKHLTGDAIDVHALINGRISWEGKHYAPIAAAFKKAAEECNVKLIWGGDWRSFPDLVHFEVIS